MSYSTNIWVSQWNALLLKQKVYCALNPQLGVWLFSSLIWCLILFEGIHRFFNSYAGTSRFLCSPVLVIGEPFTSYSADMNLSILSSLFLTISHKIGPWIVMIFAMMFPLLQRSIRHVAFSVRNKDRIFSIIIFLTGYSIIWTISGIGFIAIPKIVELLITTNSKLYLPLIASTFFFLACLLSWHISRPKIMMKCELTVPIRLNGIERFKDILNYGIMIGINCLKMCWLVMLALMFASHDFILMGLVSIIVIAERYFVPHDSKISGFAWLIISFFIVSSLFIR
jgi:predicted metal-binding membrane protein